MKKLLALTLSGWCVAAVAAARETELFNGRDLAGWTAVVDHDATGGYAAAEPTWFVTNGAVRTTGTPFGYLRTKRADFRNFTLSLDYRWWRETEKPNSGVFVRLARETGTFIPACYENQLCRGMACDLVALGGMPVAGRAPRSPYEASRPLSGITVVPRTTPTAERPAGEWNTLVVTLSGDEYVAFLNGKEQNRVKGVADGAGAIALQSEGGAVEFRNVKVRELK